MISISDSISTPYTVLITIKLMYTTNFCSGVDPPTHLSSSSASFFQFAFSRRRFSSSPPVVASPVQSRQAQLMRSFTLTRNVPVYVQLTRATQIHVQFAKHYSRPTPNFTVHEFRLNLSQAPAEILAPPFAPHMIHRLNSILQYTKLQSDARLV